MKHDKQHTLMEVWMWVRQGKILLFLFIIVINGMTKKVAKDSSNKPISQLNYQGLVNFPFLVTLTCLVPTTQSKTNYVIKAEILAL